VTDPIPTPAPIPAAAATAADVNPDRLWTRLMRLAQVGAQPPEAGGGIIRPAYGPVQAEAMALVASWMREAGLTVGIDATGNLLGVLPGSDPTRGAIALGSHLDTVPHGGAFDGALGVLAALEVAQTLHERGERLRHPLAVIGFADEEGNNFGIGVLSAQLWTGDVTADAAAGIQDGDGRSLADVLAAYRVPGVPRVERPALAAYLEAHVEQGPLLETEGRPAAAVEAIVGISRTTVTFTGRANHAGTTPMHLRRDAAWGAADLIHAVRELALAHPGRAVGTVGVLDLHPGATNVIPGVARARVELRAPDEATLQALRDGVAQRAQEAAERHGLSVTLTAWHDSPPVAMDARLIDAVRGALRDRGLPDFTMPSWAGHDAKVLARIAPVGMLFVPSIGGISHAPDEATHPADCAHAAALLLHAARRIDAALVLEADAS
jgi:beta-ureidopropionase / N-carbamoyl-L-amino-acid hydrolase